jgi:endo-1,4-beta-xylanase
MFIATAGADRLQGQQAQQKQGAWLDPDRTEPAGMKYRTFSSRLAGGEVSYLIYLPPTYEFERNRRFPAVYWLHGRGGNQRGSGWVAQRLDRAIREGKAPAMILVGVNGLPFSSYVDSADGKSPVQSVIVKELIPHVDQTYRTIGRREGRAIEGFSMGGAGAPKIAFKFPELFGAVSILAGALHDADSIAQRGDTFQTIYGGSRAYFDANSPWMLAEKNAAAVRGRTHVRITVGDKDGLLERNREYHLLLERLGIGHGFRIIEGVAHNGAALYDGLGPDNWRFFEEAFAVPATK